MNKKILIPIIVVVVLIIIIGGVFTYLLLGTDVFRSNKQAFFKYASQNEKVVNILKSEKLEAYLQKQNTTPYTSEGSIRVDISSTDPEAQSVATALQNSSITIVGNVDKANNYSYQNISLNYSDTQSMKAEYLQKGDIYAIRLNDVWNRFLGFENNNLKAFATKMGVDESIVQSIPDKINFEEIAGATKIFTEDETKQLKEKYFAIILDNLTDDMFSKENSQEGDVYTLKITEQQAENIIKKILLIVKDDEIILNKAREIMTSNLNMTLEQANNYISQFQKKIEEINNSSLSEDADISNIDTLREDADTSNLGTLPEDTNTANIDNFFEDANNSVNDTLNTNESIQEPVGNVIPTTDYSQNLIIKVYKNNNKLSKTEIEMETPTESSLNDTNVGTANSTNKIAIINSDNSVRFEVQVDSQNIYSVSIEKTENNNEINYILKAYQGTNPLGTLTINFSGINEDVVTENSELEIEYESNKIVSTYKMSKTFGASVDTNTISDNEILLINTAPSLEKIQTVVTQIAEKAVEINNSKMTAAILESNQQNSNQTISSESNSNTTQNEIQQQTQGQQSQTENKMQTQSTNEEDILRLDLTEIYYNKTQKAGKNAKITKQDLESGIKNVSVTVTENKDGTFSVTSNSTGVKYVVDSTGRIIKDETNTTQSTQSTQTTSSTVEETDTSILELHSFNSMFEAYVGKNRSDADIKALYSSVISSNESQRKIGKKHIIKINGKEPKSEPSNLNKTKKYTVTLKYDTNGFINEIKYK